MKTFIYTIAIAVGFAFFLSISDSDYQNEVAFTQTYCGMVALWTADAAAGIPTERRIGWAPYRPDIDCTPQPQTKVSK